ncbi:unnamed protein product [Sympodiomycopsis kandeliae]
MVFKAYETFLLNNASQITAVESTFRSLTYFLPGRFKDAELAGEAIYSAMNMLGMYHDDILSNLVVFRNIDTSGPQQRALQTQSQRLIPHTPSSHTRYTTHFSNSSTTYKVAARLLVIIGYTELLAEMIAKRKLSRKRTWDVVLGIEGLKAALRILLLQLTNERLSISPPIPEREVDPAVLEQEREERNLAELRSHQQRASPGALAESSVAASMPAKDTWTGSRTGFVRPTLASLRKKSESIIDPITGQQTPSPPSTSRPQSRSRSRSRFSNYSRSQGSSDDESDSNSSEETLVEPHAANNNVTSPATPWTEKTINDYLTSKALSKEEVMRPTELVRSLTIKRGRLSEYLWILRPVLYVLALKKWGTRRWEPWTISFGVEYLSHLLRRSTYASSALTGQDGAASGGLNPLLMGLLQTHPILRLIGHLIKSSTSNPKPVSQVEDAEWAKRKRAFLWYLLRGPVWTQYTRGKIGSVCDKFEGKMLLGILAAMVKEYVPLVDDLYFYTVTQ